MHLLRAQLVFRTSLMASQLRTCYQASSIYSPPSPGSFLITAQLLLFWMKQQSSLCATPWEELGAQGAAISCQGTELLGSSEGGDLFSTCLPARAPFSLPCSPKLCIHQVVPLGRIFKVSAFVPANFKFLRTTHLTVWDLTRLRANFIFLSLILKS